MKTDAMTGMEFGKQLRNGRYAWPGGYPMFLVMTDGGALCFDCAKEEAANIRLAAMTNDRSGWCPAAFDVNWESTIHCDHCGKQIESAYPVVDSED